jgi:hypothetical protein
MALKRWDLKKQGDSWAATDSGGNRHASASTKKEAVSKAAAAARGAGEPISLRIHDRDGKIAEERTYPRSADPRGSKG